MQQKTYLELFNLIKALSGVGLFTPEEELSILQFVNLRSFEAYQTSRMWPRFLIVGEPRDIVPNQTIPYAETGKDNVAEFVRIHKTQPFNRDSALEFNFYVDGNGAHLMGLNSVDSGVAYVTYKKGLATYTVDSTDFPAEFFFFVAHAAFSDFLLMDGQNEKAALEHANARNHLMLELEKVDIISNNNSLKNKMSTYVNSQSR